LKQKASYATSNEINVADEIKSAVALLSDAKEVYKTDIERATSDV